MLWPVGYGCLLISWLQVRVLHGPSKINSLHTYPQGKVPRFHVSSTSRFGRGKIFSTFAHWITRVSVLLVGARKADHLGFLRSFRWPQSFLRALGAQVDLGGLGRAVAKQDLRVEPLIGGIGGTLRPDIAKLEAAVCQGACSFPQLWASKIPHPPVNV